MILTTSLAINLRKTDRIDELLNINHTEFFISKSI